MDDLVRMLEQIIAMTHVDRNVGPVRADFDALVADVTALEASRGFLPRERGNILSRFGWRNVPAFLGPDIPEECILLGLDLPDFLPEKSSSSPSSEPQQHPSS
jgi:hypothetical protein